MHAQMNSWPAYCMYIYMYKCQQTAEMIHINTFNACTYTLQPFQTKTSLDFRNNPVSKRPGFPTTKYITSWWPQPVWTNTIQNGSFPLVRVKIKHFQNHLDYTIVFVWTFLEKDTEDSPSCSPDYSYPVPSKTWECLSQISNQNIEHYKSQCPSETRTWTFPNAFWEQFLTLLTLF